MYNIGITTLEESLSLAGNTFSKAWDVAGADFTLWEMAWSGADATNGTLVLQGALTGANWCDLPHSSATVDGPTGHAFWNIAVQGWFRFRLKFTANSNTTGTLTLVAGNKVLRAGDSPGSR